MKTIIEKLLVVYYNYLQYALEFVYSHRCSKNGVTGKCLMFHYVTDEHIDAPSTCVCKVSKFKKYICNLLKEGYSAVSIDEALDIIRKRDSKKFFIITFDDIPKSVYTNAYPFLKKKNIPFTCFIAVNLIGTADFINYDQLIELSKDPLCTIGSHTLNHSMLRHSKSKKKEIVDSKSKLQDMINQEVKFFAYPYGSVFAVDYKSIKFTKKAYLCAFSTINANLNNTSSRFKWFLPRIYVK